MHTEGRAEVADSGHTAQVERLRARRDASRWTLAVGVGMMFMGSLGASFAVGGAMMVAGGFVSTVWHGRRLRRLEGDPWQHDPELDAWEAEHLRRP